MRNSECSWDGPSISRSFDVRRKRFWRNDRYVTFYFQMNLEKNYCSLTLQIIASCQFKYYVWDNSVNLNFIYLFNLSAEISGYRSIAVPSELHGFWTIYKKFGSGKVHWSQLFEPSIALALNGFPVSSNLAMWLTAKENDILAESSLKYAN